ncbi:RsmB/NOP family class I SAM-dependent RNA methyltransferase [Parvibium lacunae]|uniref:RsmB/NOP family class I SAM-dependent RNA methyltransferase n=1 Tax=Parvibium lacunae TaxID=1888893 RepID=A0A368L6C8_9BURK|nr:RsmB/NOP family class I SAM-dependent RNA methyltransferase [Parvibium lacunae]RCS58710.1 RsmB/NOP family class I SAM-dependent RNA methyltransferase [Parvibium lacunae]
MRVSTYVVSHLEELLRELLKFQYPADAVVHRYFKLNPKLGTRERALLAEAAYAVLRWRTLFQHFSDGMDGSLRHRFALLGLCEITSPAAFDTLLAGQERAWLHRVSAVNRDSLPLLQQTNLPQWLLERLIADHGREVGLAYARASLQSAPLDIRVNRMRAEVDGVLSQLQTAGITAHALEWLPDAIRIQGRPALQKLEAYQQGWFEVQDAGSQVLAHLLAPKRGEMVLDFCAGAGGKTLALGALMRSAGRLYACDISENRLAKLKPRLARSGLSNVTPIRIEHEGDQRLKRLAGKLDKVLVDAPCSGLGTLRRNPDLKWRQTEQTVQEMQDKQQRILAAAAKLLKPGGVLVYATCSVLQAENQAVVEQFLHAHSGFTVQPVTPILKQQKIELPVDDGPYLQLWPQQHATDAFFAAVLQKN